MNRYVALAVFDKKGMHAFRSAGPVDDDIRKSIQWGLDHQKGREFASKSFGLMRYRWADCGQVKLPIADMPSSPNSFGIFSEKAVNVLRVLLEKHGDIHPLIMESGERYFLFDCWSFVQFESILIANIEGIGNIKGFDVASDIILPDVFSNKKWPGLIVNEQFKSLAEDAGLSGAIFSPVTINRVASQCQ